jgi:hypothetical protein
MDWSIFLFILKWIFLGLVYLVLLLLLVAVQREMRMRLPSAQSASAVAFGRLRVLQPGSDTRLRPGALLALQPETSIGSQAGNDLVLLDRYVSSNHARLHWDGVTWWVEDLSSTNGTFVNQQRLAPGASQALPTGALLTVGDVSFEMMES